jgi:TPR repeat protein
VKRAHRKLLMLSCAALCSPLLTGRVVAENSSWFSRQTSVPKSEPSKTPQSKAPAQPRAPSGQSGSSEVEKSIPSMVPVSGDNAAYIAFDQGQYLTALKLAEEEAKRGEPTAYTLMGRIYGDGLGVPKDDSKAYTNYAKAAELGDVQGTFEAGVALAEGRGVKKNRKVAAELFEKAALTGHAEANYNLGRLFLKGDGKPQNPIRAFQHIQYAAQKGLAQAQYDLAELYQTGTGTEPNALEAARWLSRAAEQGLTAAQYDYAVRLLQGFGLTKDESKIPMLMRAAADKGVPGAQNRMAYLYLDGIKVKKDLVEAAKWRLIAKKNGFADKTLDTMVAKLPQAERRKAATEASAWNDKIRVGEAQ